MAFFLDLASPLDGSGGGGGGSAGMDAGLRVFRLPPSSGISAPQNRKFPIVRKILLPIFSVIVVVSVLVLHIVHFPSFSLPSSSSSVSSSSSSSLLSIGFDPLLLTQDILIASAFLTVILIAILMPWERAILLPVEKKCRHQCQVVPR